MRILVLGAGALGGYFGGRLAEAGGDVTFVVRPGRAQALAERGLVIDSPFGNATLRVNTAQQAGPGYDLVLLTCKAYDLDSAIEAIRPAMQEGTAVLPVLNGLSHVDRLKAEFGPENVLGGFCKIQATMLPDGTIRQFNDWRWLTFGELDGRMSGRVEALAALGARAKGVVVTAVPDILAQMWEKLVHLATSAACTVMMRANTGEIVRAGGAGFLLRLFERNAQIARHEGFPPSEEFLAGFRKVFTDPEGQYSTSMLRDLEAGGRIEADHILGFMLAAAKRAGVPHEIHEAAYLHAKSYEQRRDAGRLPR